MACPRANGTSKRSVGVEEAAEFRHRTEEHKHDRQSDCQLYQLNAVLTPNETTKFTDPVAHLSPHLYKTGIDNPPIWESRGWNVPSGTAIDPPIYSTSSVQSAPTFRRTKNAAMRSAATVRL